MSEFQFGLGNNPKRPGGCCGKPQGCNLTEKDGCMLMTHPIKRAMLLGDESAPCPAAAQKPHPESGEWVRWPCSLIVGHAGACAVKPPRA